MKNLFKILLIVLASSMFANNLIVNYDNKNKVDNWPENLTTFTLNKSTNISSIETYHWNNARGSTGNKYGAYIKLKKLNTNKTYGPWKATLKSGMNGAKNVYWVVYPNITLPAGKYLVLDSDSATWSHNTGTKGIGFTKIFSKTLEIGESKKVERKSTKCNPLVASLNKNSFTASTAYDNRHSAYYAKLNNTTTFANWSSSQNNKNQWITIDFKQKRIRCAIATKGRHKNYTQYVKTYFITYSNDNMNWVIYKENGNKKIFQGNYDVNTISKHILKNQFQARYVKFNPISWQSHISMRVEVYGE